MKTYKLEYCVKLRTYVVIYLANFLAFTLFALLASFSQKPMLSRVVRCKP